MSFQFDCPERGEGVVQAFRCAKCPGDRIRIRLRSLDTRAAYALTNLDVAGTTEMAGRELLENGLVLVLWNRPGAVLVGYRKKG
jgi:hypothetical protein